MTSFAVARFSLVGIVRGVGVSLRKRKRPAIAPKRHAGMTDAAVACADRRVWLVAKFLRRVNDLGRRVACALKLQGVRVCGARDALFVA
jgi:hypothetical protein